MATPSKKSITPKEDKEVKEEKEEKKVPKTSGDDPSCDDVVPSFAAVLQQTPAFTLAAGAPSRILAPWDESSAAFGTFNVDGVFDPMTGVFAPRQRGLYAVELSINAFTTALLLTGHVHVFLERVSRSAPEGKSIAHTYLNVGGSRHAAPGVVLNGSISTRVLLRSSESLQVRVHNLSGAPVTIIGHDEEGVVTRFSAAQYSSAPRSLGPQATKSTDVKIDALVFILSKLSHKTGSGKAKDKKKRGMIEET